MASDLTTEEREALRPLLLAWAMQPTPGSVDAAVDQLVELARRAALAAVPRLGTGEREGGVYAYGLFNPDGKLIVNSLYEDFNHLRSIEMPWDALLPGISTMRSASIQEAAREKKQRKLEELGYAVKRLRLRWNPAPASPDHGEAP